MRKLDGIIIPAVTPFDREGAIDFAALRANYHRWNATAVCGYMCLGSNGEFRMLDDDEALEVIRASAQAAGEDKCFIAGIGRESLTSTLRFLRRVEQANLPIDYLSVLTPHYFKGLMTDEALVDYYTAIADASSLPILLYCAPDFANSVCISAEAVKTLADHPNIHGIKDTSKNMMNAYMDAVGGREDFQVLSGSMSTILTCLSRGGKGGVVSAANYFPEECAKVVALYQEQGEAAAQSYYDTLQALIRRTGARGSVSGVKCCMNLLGYSGGLPRRPVLPASPALEQEMREALIEGGYTL